MIKSFIKHLTTRQTEDASKVDDVSNQESTLEDHMQSSNVILFDVDSCDEEKSQRREESKRLNGQSFSVNSVKETTGVLSEVDKRELQRWHSENSLEECLAEMTRQSMVFLNIEEERALSTGEKVYDKTTGCMYNRKGQRVDIRGRVINEHVNQRVVDELVK